RSPVAPNSNSADLEPTPEPSCLSAVTDFVALGHGADNQFCNRLQKTLNKPLKLRHVATVSTTGVYFE
ncbi:MAG TPA: hypothetical protein PK808_08685, partial [Polymorphobacter sp.]|nr:hypothetical protein [Polymorphobacter sp.]